MKLIKVLGSNTTICVTNAEEMYFIFFRLHPWCDLEVDGEVYPSDVTTGYTRSYFEAKYFERG